MASWRWVARLAPGGALAAALAAGCGDAAHKLPSAPVVVAYPSTLTSLHPALSSDEFSYSILSNVFEPLVDVDGRQSLRPGLAVAWHSPDDLTWRFELRQGAKFHDGRPVEAAAVAASLERARVDPALRQTAVFEAVERFTALGTGTVEVRTRYPVPELAARLTELGIWSEPRSAGGAPEGSGPYRVARWSPGGDVELERVGGAGSERLIFRAIPNAAERQAALRRSAVDLIAEVPAAGLEALRRAKDLRVVESRGLRVLFLGMNCAPGARPDVGPGANPFHDPRVRRAVALAIDRHGLVRGPLGGLAEELDQPLAPEVFGYGSGLAPLPYDPEESRRLLAQAGREGGFETALDFVPGKYRDVDGVIAAIVSDLGRVGIRVKPRPAPYPQYLDRLDRRDTPFYLRGWSTSVSAGQTYDFLLRSPGQGFGSANASAYSNAELDALLAAAAREPDDAKRLVRLQRAAEIIRADLPLVPLYRQVNLYAARAGLAFEPRLDRTIRGAELSWTR